jgi:hypothetical protein
MFNKTHASITKSLTKMISDLDALAEANAAKVIAKQAQIENLNKDIVSLDMEVVRCNNTAEKLKSILE